MDRRALDLAAVSGITAAGLGVIRRVDLFDAAVGCQLAAGAGDEVRTLQPALRPVGVQALILGDRLRQKVLGLDPDLTRERDGVRALLGMDRVIFNLEGLGFVLGVVRDDELHRAQNGHGALRRVVEILAQAMLQKGIFDGVRGFCHADALAEVADGVAGVAAAAQAAERRHARIIPAGDIILLDQLAKLALGHDGVVNAETGKLDLPGPGRDGDVVHDPVVERAVRFKLQRAKAVRDALQRVLNGVGKVVHRIDAPLVALPVVMHVADAVDDGVAHVEVAGGQIDLGAQRAAALGELAVFHARKQVEIFLDRAVAVRRDGGLADLAAVLTELLRGQIADVGQPLFDELDRELVVLFKIIRAIEEAVAPVKAQPVNVLLDRVDVFGVLLRRVRVVHAQVAQAAEFLRGAKVDRQRLAVADVQISVRLRREPGVNGLALKPAAGGQILFNEGVNEISVLQRLSFFIHVPILRMYLILNLFIIPEVRRKRNHEITQTRRNVKKMKTFPEKMIFPLFNSAILL